MLFSESRLTQIFHYFRPRTRPLFPVNLRNLTSVWFGVRLQGHMATLDPSELNSTKIFLQLPWASELGLWCTHQEFKPFKYMRFLKSYLFVCSYPLVQFGIIPVSSKYLLDWLEFTYSVNQAYWSVTHILHKLRKIINKNGCNDIFE